jgi:Fe-S oxidoreductase/nitrate reductase gamma subunit
MYAIMAVALGIMVFGFFRRYRIWRSGKALSRREHLGARVSYFIRTAMNQKKVLRVKSAGLPHAAFFWGFTILFAASLLIMVQIDFLVPVLHVTFLKGWFYRFFALGANLAGIACILGLAALSVRRFVIRPPGLVTVADDYVMHGLLFAILITGFLIDGARIAATELRTNPTLASWSPGGLLVAQALKGMSVSSLRGLHRLLWWVHLGLVFGFFSVIPFTKLRHLFTTPFNYLFRSREPKGSIAAINFEDETIEQYGAAQVADLTWKDIYDADACTSCKRCQDRCPAWNTGKRLSPMTVVQEIGRVAFDDPGRRLTEAISTEAIWACTTCRACEEICPAEIEHVNKILALRRNLVLMEGSFPGDEVRTAINNVEVNGNPFGLPYATRGDWAAGLDLQLVEQADDIDVLYFVGCYASFDKRNQEVARSFVRICNAAGVRIGILGKKERCCGEPARKLGNEYLFQTLAQANIEAIEASRATQIVTTCPHCYNTLARDYRDLGLGIPAEHYTTFLDRLLRDGRLPILPAGFEFTYHDSCYIGRYRDIFGEPRNVLAAAGGQLTEMEKSGYESFCCGGGGGRILAEERVGQRINVERVLMARATGKPLLISNCPFCLTEFEDGIKTANCEEDLQVRDLAEILAERIEAHSLAGAANGSA